MYCNACGHNNPENAKFCSKCAAVLEMKVPVVERGFDSSPAAIRRSRVGTLIGLAAMAIGLGILAILFVQLRNGNGRPKESSSSSQDTRRQQHLLLVPLTMRTMRDRQRQIPTRSISPQKRTPTVPVQLL